MPPERHETQPLRTIWTFDVQNLGKIAILKCPRQPFRTKWALDVKNLEVDFIVFRCRFVATGSRDSTELRL